MNPSPAIGSSIFMYIIAFIAVMVVAGFFTYRTSQRKKRQREADRDNQL